MGPIRCRNAFLVARVISLHLGERKPRHLCRLSQLDLLTDINTRQCTGFVSFWQLDAVLFAVLDDIAQCQHFRDID
ncbi:hypothetical protein D3C75_1310570 [compost metagenome]